MTKWNRQPQERDGDYCSNGWAFITRDVRAELSSLEIMQIIRDLRRAADEHDGLDYLQVYEADDGRTVWVIDQLSRRMKEGGQYSTDPCSSRYSRQKTTV